MTSLITEPSICIPRTLNNVGWREVKEVFEKIFGKGTVERVDIVTRRDDDSPFCRIFVHMRYWAVNVPEVAAFRNALLASETRKVVYNHPWFWKCAASRTPKPVKQRVSAEPYIMMDSAPTATSSEPPPSTEPQHHTPEQKEQRAERPAGELEDMD
jgi:hypothetical protein